MLRSPIKSALRSVVRSRRFRNFGPSQMYGAVPLVPDTVGTVGNTRINPITGLPARYWVNLCPPLTANTALGSNVLSGLTRTLVENSANSAHFAADMSGITLVNGAQYDIAVRVSPVSGSRFVSLYLNGIGVNRCGVCVDLSNGSMTDVITGNGSVVSKVATQITDGWLVRAVVTATAWGGLVNCVARLENSSSGLTVYQGDGTSSVSVTGLTITAAANTVPPPQLIAENGSYQEPLTVPGYAGSRPLTWWGAFAGATNLAINNSTISPGWGGYGVAAETSHLPTESYNGTTITPQRMIVITANSTRGRALSTNPALLVGPSSFSVSILVRRIDGVTPCDLCNYLGGVTGASSGIIATAAQIAAQPVGVWVLYRYTRTYVSGTPGQWGIGRGGGGAVGEGCDWALPTLVTGRVPPPLIISGGTPASITADAVSLSSVTQFAAGSPLLSQPWCMILGVRLEGHSIGATGHVSGAVARVWDHNGGASFFGYPVANKRMWCSLLDSGTQVASSADNAAPDEAGAIVVYAIKYVPGVGLYLYRNGIIIAEDLTVGVLLSPWTSPLYLGNITSLTRAITGWVTNPFLITGRNVPLSEIAAMSNPALWRMVA